MATETKSGLDRNAVFLERLQEIAQIVAIPKQDLTEFPMPFDAEWKIEDGELVITGGVGPCGFGKATVRLPFNADSLNTLHCDFTLEAQVFDSADRNEATVLVECINWLRLTI